MLVRSGRRQHGGMIRLRSYLRTVQTWGLRENTRISLGGFRIFNR